MSTPPGSPDAARGARATPLVVLAPAACTLSLIVPALDEEPNLVHLYRRIAAVFEPRADLEIVLVDDGSRDGTARVMRELAAQDVRVVCVFLGGNHGQTAALAAGLAQARGALIATLDADLQNDPADLPLLLERLEGQDAVVGYRARRCDGFVRRASSRIANGVRNWVSRDRIRDTGCSLKVFRAEALRSLPLFEGMHRFLPTLLRYRGYRVLEVPVSHHPRRAGKSKYGIRNRAWRASKDLLAVRWMRARMIRLSVREVVRGR